MRDSIFGFEFFKRLIGEGVGHLMLFFHVALDVRKMMMAARAKAFCDFPFNTGKKTFMGSNATLEMFVFASLLI